MFLAKFRKRILSRIFFPSSFELEQHMQWHTMSDTVYIEYVIANVRLIENDHLEVK